MLHNNEYISQYYKSTIIYANIMHTKNILANITQERKYISQYYRTTNILANITQQTIYKLILHNNQYISQYFTTTKT